ncbi:unnamed protein product, partial [marine sediment metagenome]
VTELFVVFPVKECLEILVQEGRIKDIINCGSF